MMEPPGEFADDSLLSEKSQYTYFKECQRGSWVGEEVEGREGCEDI